MTLDAQTLVTLTTGAPGVEAIALALSNDENPRVPATALAEAAIILTERGVRLPCVVLQILVDRLHLTVVPFTSDHWREAVKVYKRSLEEDAPRRPSLGRCMSEGIAAKLGASLLIPER